MTRSRRTNDHHGARSGSAPVAREWNEAYLGSSPPCFDIGVAAPPIVRWLRLLRPGGRAAVLGCGRGHEVRATLDAGWRHVTGVDFAPAALQQARGLTPSTLRRRTSWLERDVFDLPRTHSGEFDLVLEHTCFTAIAPTRRAAWRRTVEQLLSPNGIVLALFSFIHPRPGGPPYHASTAQLDALLDGSRRLRVVHREIPHDSVAARAANEYLMLAVRR